MVHIFGQSYQRLVMAVLFVNLVLIINNHNQEQHVTLKLQAEPVSEIQAVTRETR